MKLFWHILLGALLLSILCVTFNINHLLIPNLLNWTTNVFKFSLYSIIFSLIVCAAIKRIPWHLINKYLIKNHLTENIFDSMTHCVMLTGAWGSGKTTYYNKELKNIIQNGTNKKQIYISCFSATKSELISQIISKDPLYSVLTLNGLLNKFIESNWQSFMPKNSVIIFDDLERLHKNKDDILDVIGIIDYLKKCENNNEILLICNLDENNDILNKYMEKIVDDVIDISEYRIKYKLNYFIEDIYQNKSFEIIPEKTKKFFALQFTKTINDNIINHNLRLVRNTLNKLLYKLVFILEQSNYTNKTIINDIDIIILNDLIDNFSNNMDFYIKLHHLFYMDHSLYKKIAYSNYSTISYIKELQLKLTSDKKEEKENSENELKKYSKILKSKFKLNLEDILKKNFSQSNPLDNFFNLLEIYNFVFKSFLPKHLNLDNQSFGLHVLAAKYINHKKRYEKLLAENYEFFGDSNLIYNKLDKTNFYNSKQYNELTHLRNHLFSESNIIKFALKCLNLNFLNETDLRDILDPKFFIWCSILIKFGFYEEVIDFIRKIIAKKYMINQFKDYQFKDYYIFFYERGLPLIDIFYKAKFFYNKVLNIYSEELWKIIENDISYESRLKYLTLLAYNYQINSIQNIIKQQSLMKVFEAYLLDQKSRCFEEHIDSLIEYYFLIAFQIRYQPKREIVNKLKNNYTNVIKKYTYSPQKFKDFSYWFNKLINNTLIS